MVTWAEFTAEVPEFAEFVEARLRAHKFLVMATVRADGAPHLVPVLAVVVDGRLFLAAGGGTRKAADLARDARCVLATNAAGADVVVEGTAAKVGDEDVLQRVAATYLEKYAWEVEVRDGAFHAGGAPTAGPPPYDVYEVTPATAFTFATGGPSGSARYEF
jgi:general stress protein 26